MRPVLIRTSIGTAIAALISYAMYKSFSRSLDKEIVMIISYLSLCCAVPMVVGYIASAYLIKKYHQFLYFFNIALLVINGFLLGGAALLSLAVATNAPLVLFSFLYLGVGAYVFYETILNFNKAKALNNSPLEEDILDDNFLK